MSFWIYLWTKCTSQFLIFHSLQCICFSLIFLNSIQLQKCCLLIVSKLLGTLNIFLALFTHMHYNSSWKLYHFFLQLWSRHCALSNIYLRRRDRWVNSIGKITTWFRIMADVWWGKVTVISWGGRGLCQSTLYFWVDMGTQQ